jgi:hypothetical protein
MYEVWIVVPGIAPEPDHWVAVMTTTKKENAVSTCQQFSA